MEVKPHEQPISPAPQHIIDAVTARLVVPNTTLVGSSIIEVHETHRVGPWPLYVFAAYFDGVEFDRGGMAVAIGTADGSDTYPIISAIPGAADYVDPDRGDIPDEACALLVDRLPTMYSISALLAAAGEPDASSVRARQIIARVRREHQWKKETEVRPDSPSPGAD